MKEWSYNSTPPIGRTACTEPQCLYKRALYPFFFFTPWREALFPLKMSYISRNTCKTHFHCWPQRKGGIPSPDFHETNKFSATIPEEIFCRISRKSRGHKKITVDVNQTHGVVSEICDVSWTCSLFCVLMICITSTNVLPFCGCNSIAQWSPTCFGHVSATYVAILKVLRTKIQTQSNCV